jgi:hypothetical protein
MTDLYVASCEQLYFDTEALEAWEGNLWNDMSGLPKHFVEKLAGIAVGGSLLVAGGIVSLILPRPFVRALFSFMG